MYYVCSQSDFSNFDQSASTQLTRSIIKAIKDNLRGIFTAALSVSAVYSHCTICEGVSAFSSAEIRSVSKNNKLLARSLSSMT